jgi:predicted nucleotidyltransferase component of viral defense system
VKDYLRDLVTERSLVGLEPRYVVREYVQARILGSLQRSGAMTAIAFHGGTALRFLYGIPRFSEDLDFALEDRSHGFDLRTSLRRIRTDLVAEGYDVDLRLKDSMRVHSGLVKLHGLFFELGLSARREEVLRVKIEVDTNPPLGAVLETTLVRRYVTLRLYHHDRSSMLAGKLHAVLQRTWTKGRDLFDLLWYLSDPEWPEPNLKLLNNALRQTGWTSEPLTPSTWRRVLHDRLLDLDWDQVASDVRPFLEPSADIGLVTLDNLLVLLQRGGRYRA